MKKPPPRTALSIIRKTLLVSVTSMGISVTGCCGTIVNELLDTKDKRTKVGTCEIDASDTTLNLFASGVTGTGVTGRELLLRYLCSSAEWRVTRFGETPAIGGTIVALKRAKGDGHFSGASGEEGEEAEEGEVAAGVPLTLPEGGSGGTTFREESEGGCWHTTLHGYVSDFNADTVLQSRVMIRLEGYKPRSEDGWIRSGCFDKGMIGDGAVTLNMYKPDYEQPGIESYLVLEGKGIWLEIYEQANSEDRAFTQKTIDGINRELLDLLDRGPTSAFSPDSGSPQRDAVPLWGKSLLPPGSMIISDSSEIIIDDGMQPGIYMAHGYVNPGEAGWTYFKVFNADTGVTGVTGVTGATEVMYEMEQKRTIEYVGWSDNPREKFFFDCEVWCMEGDWEHEYPARFELWFVPEEGKDGGKERLLGTTERRIYGWQR